ncbi:MarR family winged helix-turn-helix transcriptional regulator [Altericroceibacterium endophyticum]|uniref:MarR family transcriptional regulator n=1 Tax=Altericroceibacterium endophyticum TaxID=1808508 RepID=A0A6I4T815_9SPHN|nr:MarR family transcriptional regulator [Altericroceibacterium endophyticum]MXO66818.1 MarR family transcriptional regulator [Altericroceibacterium endophyticum]
MTDIETTVTAFAALYLKFVRQLDSRMAANGVSLSRTKILLCLQKRGPMRSTSIADIYNLAPRTVTELIDALEKDGFLERQPDPSDRRAKLVSLTPEGIEAVNKTEPLRRELVDQIFGILDTRELSEFRGMLDKLSLALDELPDD